MPSFDIVSEVDHQEIDNALNQARKELATRFDFKGSTAAIEFEKDKIVLTAEDANRLRGLREIVINKLSKRERRSAQYQAGGPAISSMGHARQELKLQQGLEGEKAKEIIAAIKGAEFQNAERAPGSPDSRHRKKAGRTAGRDRVRARKGFRRGDEFQEFPRLRRSEDGFASRPGRVANPASGKRDVLQKASALVRSNDFASGR